MNKLNPQERVWMALNHEEPDRVPIYEGTIETQALLRGKAPLNIAPGLAFLPLDGVRILTSPFIRPLLPTAFAFLDKPRLFDPIVKPSFNQATWLHRKLGLDLMGFTAGLPKIFSPHIFEGYRVESRTLIGPHENVVTQLPTEEGAVLRNGYLQSPADYEKYMEFDPDHKSNYFMAQKVRKIASDKIALAFSIFGAAYFETMTDMFGFQKLSRLLIREPNFIHKVVQDLYNYSTAVTKHLLERGVRLFYMSDDLGQKGRGLISPRMYKTYFHESIKKYVQLVHQHGGKVIRHSCGNFESFLPFILKEKIDAMHPWETSSGMNIFDAKKKYGANLTLVGNVPIELLRSGTTKQVVAYVKKLMKICAPGGGYILSSSHSIVPPCKWENYIAMLWAAKKYGRYR